MEKLTLASFVVKEALKMRLSKGAYVATPNTVKNEIRTTAFMLAQYAKLNPLRSDVSSAAHKWASLSLRAAALDDDVDKDDLDDLMLALDQAGDIADTEETSDIPKDDILH